MIGIIDYGMGNIHSVKKALESLGASTAVIRKPQGLAKFSKMVLPGVGAFDDAMRALKACGFIPAIKEYIETGRPFLGICLGMQLFFESSQEALNYKGMGILKGKVARFSKRPGLKVPHMGWNQLKTGKGKCLLLRNIPANSFVYFCHSYFVLPKEKEVTAAVCSYGTDFAAVVCKDNIYGVQFHPEKSQGTGLNILKNFIEIC